MGSSRFHASPGSSRGSRTRGFGPLTVLATSIAVVACAGGSSHASRSPQGAEVFVRAGCGSCHTLSAAHAHGTVGPNLDVLSPSAGLVKQQVLHGGAGMPAFDRRLSAAEIHAVAEYVASVTAPGSVLSAEEAAAAQGARLYTSLGCEACHSIGGRSPLAPSFSALAGSSVTLATGRKAKATISYLEGAISGTQTPVAGYPATMAKVARRLGLTGRLVMARDLAQFINSIAGYPDG